MPDDNPSPAFDNLPVVNGESWCLRQRRLRRKFRCVVALLRIFVSSNTPRPRRSETNNRKITTARAQPCGQRAVEEDGVAAVAAHGDHCHDQYHQRGGVMPPAAEPGEPPINMSRADEAGGLWMSPIGDVEAGSSCGDTVRECRPICRRRGGLSAYGAFPTAV